MLMRNEKEIGTERRMDIRKRTSEEEDFEEGKLRERLDLLNVVEHVLGQVELLQAQKLLEASESGDEIVSKDEILHVANILSLGSSEGLKADEGDL